MKFWKRLGLFCLLFVMQILYFPLNHLLYGGVMPKTPLDQYIPLWPVWAVPYLLAWPWWIACAVWAAWKMDDQMYRAAIPATFVVIATGVAFFAFYPTYVTRPVLDGQGWAVELLRWIYKRDRGYNAFPSGHVYLTTLITLFWSRWYPRYRWLWWGVVAVILLSTLFTHQHYLPDLLGGLVLAWGGYHFGWWCASRWKTGRDQPPLDTLSN